jgi:hypothetical protein
MTRLNKPADPVKPSAPDPVDTWLDVLVAMLAIPRPDRQRVRDELEDHLRSRIDDLLIHGLTEPQALQKAVAELGETADLARQLSHAHKPPRTRRFAMHALIIALAGTVVALGVNTMRPGAALPAAAAVQPNAEVVSALSEPIAIRDKTIGEVFESFRSHVERPVMIHWTLLENLGLKRDARVQIDADSLPIAVILKLLSERTEPVLRDSIAMLETPGLIEIGLRSQFDQRTMARRNYDISSLTGYTVVLPNSGRVASLNTARGTRSTDGPVGLASLIETHVSPKDWVKAGGDLARYSIIGNTLVITAPERLHDQIASVLEDLEDTRDSAFHEALSIVTSNWTRLRARHERLENEYADLFEQWTATVESRAEAADAQDAIDPAIFEITSRRSEDLATRMRSIRVRQSAIRAEMDEIVAEWELDVDGASPDAASGQVGPDTGVFYYWDNQDPQGAVPVAVIENLTVSEFLAARGVDPENAQDLSFSLSVQGQAGRQVTPVPVPKLFEDPSLDQVLLPGHRLVLHHLRPDSNRRGR